MADLRKVSQSKTNMVRLSGDGRRLDCAQPMLLRGCGRADRTAGSQRGNIAGLLNHRTPRAVPEATGIKVKPPAMRSVVQLTGQNRQPWFQLPLMKQPAHGQAGRRCAVVETEKRTDVLDLNPTRPEDYGPAHSFIQRFGVGAAVEACRNRNLLFFGQVQPPSARLTRRRSPSAGTVFSDRLLGTGSAAL